MNEWVVELIELVENAIKGDGKISFQPPSGPLVIAEVTKELLEFIRDNQGLLMEIGRETFMTFLQYKSEGKDLEALEAVFSKLDTIELVELAQSTAISMDQHAKKLQRIRKLWMTLAISLTSKIAFCILKIVFI